MTCTDIRSLLPAHVYGDLPADDAAEIVAHLRRCPACRAECAELSQVRLALDAVRVPNVRVDVSQLFHTVADRQARRVRRWRRLALAGASIAAGLLLVLGLKLEVRAGDGQITLTWGDRPAAPRQVEAAPPSQEAQTQADYHGLEERVRLLQDVTLALAADVESRDRQKQVEMVALRVRLDAVQQVVAHNWSEAQRLMSALYVAHFKRPEEKSNP